MTRSTLTDSAFEGFRITRENPAAVALWTVVVLIGSAVTTQAMESTGAMPVIMAAMKASPPNAADMFSAAQKLLPVLPLIFAVGLFVAAIVQTAVNRAILRPSDKAFGYLRLGVDEGRTLAVKLAVTLIQIALYFVALMVAALLARLMGPFGAVLAVLIVLAAIGGLIFIAVRLSLAVSSSFADRRMDLRPSLDLSKGRFWSMMGVYVVAVILAGVVMVLGQVIASAVTAAVGGGADAMPPLMSAPGLIILVLSSILQTLAYVILYGASAAVYRHLAHGGTSEVI